MGWTKGWARISRAKRADCVFARRRSARAAGCGACNGHELGTGDRNFAKQHPPSAKLPVAGAQIGQDPSRATQASRRQEEVGFFFRRQKIGLTGVGRAEMRCAVCCYVGVTHAATLDARSAQGDRLPLRMTSRRICCSLPLCRSLHAGERAHLPIRKRALPTLYTPPPSSHLLLFNTLATPPSQPQSSSRSFSHSLSPSVRPLTCACIPSCLPRSAGSLTSLH